MTVLRRLQLFPRCCCENSRSCSVSRDNLTDLPLFLTGDLSRPRQTTAAHLHSWVSHKNTNNGSDVREVINSGSARCDVVLVLSFHMTKCASWREMKAALQFQSFLFHNTTALTTFSGIWRRVKTPKHSLQGFTRFHLSSPVSLRDELWHEQKNKPICSRMTTPFSLFSFQLQTFVMFSHNLIDWFIKCQKVVKKKVSTSRSKPSKNPKYFVYTKKSS